MPDREKVINGLRSIKAYLASQAFETEDSFAREGFIESQKDIDDAIALLKEQEAVEPKTGHWIVLEYCANEGIYCSECHMKIFDRLTKPKKNLSQYCPHCGSRNEQFFRNGEVVFR